MLTNKEWLALTKLVEDKHTQTRTWIVDLTVAITVLTVIVFVQGLYIVLQGKQ